MELQILKYLQKTLCLNVSAKHKMAIVEKYYNQYLITTTLFIAK